MQIDDPEVIEALNKVLNFFDYKFDKSLTLFIIRKLYLVGIMAIIISPLYFYYYMGANEVNVVLYPILSFILWRIICEIILLFFNIHERLKEIGKIR